MKRLSIPKHGFSVRSINAEPRSIDWSDLGEDGDSVRVVLPAPTYGDWQDRDSDVPGRIARRKRDAIMSDADRAEFEETDAFYDWRAAFDPMMNYAWPVTLAYGVTEADAAAGIDAFGSACSLIELSEQDRDTLFGDDGDAPEYVIALNGGGMDLSDHIAAAYLACGCVPPSRIIELLSGTISPTKARAIRLREAMGEAIDQHKRAADRVRAERARIFAKPKAA